MNITIYFAVILTYNKIFRTGKLATIHMFQQKNNRQACE